MGGFSCLLGAPNQAYKYELKGLPQLHQIQALNRQIGN